MDKYVCPYSIRMKQHSMLLCKRSMKEGVNYTLKENVWPAVCVEQFYCHITKRMENTQEAKKCYQSQKELI